MSYNEELKKNNQDLAEILRTVNELPNAGGGIEQETDPTVPDWAKQPQKPTYTAEEVGAQPKGDYVLRDELPEIPEVPETLPNPNKLTFTGAVQAEYDGSEEVTVKIPEGGGGGIEVTGASVGQTIVVKAVDDNGKPTEWEPVAFGPRPFKKLCDITLTEETGNVRSISISQDMDGNPIDCTMLYCYMYIVPSVGTDGVNIYVKDQTGSGIISTTNNSIKADKTWYLQAIGGINLPSMYQYHNTAAILTTSSMNMRLDWTRPSRPDKITTLEVSMNWTPTGTVFGPDSRIEIWGA